jgi:hypothetical protein
MPRHCYSPTRKFVRVYFHATEGQEPTLYDKDLIWGQVKARHFLIDTVLDARVVWEDDEEEAEERATWFEGWDDPRCWSSAPAVMLDTHY